jgi:hypothetical protein
MRFAFSLSSGRGVAEALERVAEDATAIDRS